MFKPQSPNKAFQVTHPHYVRVFPRSLRSLGG